MNFLYWSEGNRGIWGSDKNWLDFKIKPPNISKFAKRSVLYIQWISNIGQNAREKIKIF